MSRRATAFKDSVRVFESDAAAIDVLLGNVLAHAGLGLDIASATARSAGGELHIRSSRLGGARLELDLPLVDEDR